MIYTKKKVMKSKKNNRITLVMLANHNENRLSFEAENNGDLPL